MVTLPPSCECWEIPAPRAKRDWPAFHLPWQCYFSPVFCSSLNTQRCPGHAALKSNCRQALLLARGCCMNVTVNKTLQDRLVPGGFWKQLMHQCGKGQAQTAAKTYQRQSLEFTDSKLPAPHFRAFLQRPRAAAVLLCHSTSHKSPLSTTQNSPSTAAAPAAARGSLAAAHHR